MIVDPLVRLAYDARTDLALAEAGAPPLVDEAEEGQGKEEEEEEDAAVAFPASPPERITACYLDAGKHKKNKRVDYSTCG